MVTFVTVRDRPFERRKGRCWANWRFRMGYRSESIAVAVGRLNQQYFLPAIQREFVWKPEQIVQLFDSILRGYPISSFLFWAIQPENRDKWQAYKFLDKAYDGGTHNESAQTDGITDLTLILDGQQRLTSLMLGLRGVYVTKKKHKRWNNPDAWMTQRLYIDLLGDPNEFEGGDEDGLYYHFRFLEDVPPPSADAHWFRVGKVLDFDSEKKFEDYLDSAEQALPDSVTKGQTRIFRKNFERMYRAIHRDEVIAYYTETDQDADRVLDIFVRANEGGTKLSKSDLLLSMVTSSWDGMNARDEIFGFLDHVNQELTRKNDLDKDFIMKACLVLTDLPVAYKVQNFSSQNLQKIRANWNAIKKAIESGVDLANSFGIDRDNLVSANALIPIVYFLFRNPQACLRGSSAFEVRNADLIRKWLILVSVNGVFGGASDNILRDIRSAIQASPIGSDFPMDAIADSIRRSNRNASFDDYAIDTVLDLAYGQRLTFMALSLLYEDAGWGTMPYHEDHIFARSLFKAKELTAGGQSDWLVQRDRLANLCLLLGHENQGKQDMALDKWLASRDPGFIKRHLIPSDPSLWQLDRFDDFLAAREMLIRDRLKQLLIGQQTHPQTTL